MASVYGIVELKLDFYSEILLEILQYRIKKFYELLLIVDFLYRLIRLDIHGKIINDGRGLGCDGLVPLDFLACMACPGYEGEQILVASVKLKQAVVKLEERCALAVAVFAVYRRQLPCLSGNGINPFLILAYGLDYLDRKVIQKKAWSSPRSLG